MNQIQGLESALNRNGWSLQNFSSILDFGCGSGRLSQYLYRLTPKAQFFGCDLDSHALIEAQRLCPNGHFQVNNSRPPLDFDTGQFDLVLSYSVFTNISEASHMAWLTELGRVLQTGGVMLHTVHSYEYLRRTAFFSPENLEKYKFPSPVQELSQSRGEYHYISPDGWPPDYGFAVISKDYVMTRWPGYTGLSLMDYEEAAIESYPEGCQDIVILAREPVQRHF